MGQDLVPTVAAKAETAPALNEFQQMAAEQIEDSKESGQELSDIEETTLT